VSELTHLIHQSIVGQTRFKKFLAR